MFRPAALTALLLLALAPAGASAASTAIGFSPDPTEEVSVTITVSGAADGATRLYVYVTPGGGSCAATASGNLGSYEISGSGPWSGGEPIAAGAYHRVYAYTPASATGHRVCAYLAASPATFPEATADALLTPRRPTATVQIAASADPTEEASVSYTVTGTTEVGRRVYAYATPGGGSCPATASGNLGSYEISGTGPWSGGEAIPAGPFSRTYDHTPADSGLVRVCAYVAETASDVPNGAATHLTAVREPTASLALTVAGALTKRQNVTVSASGTSEAGRRLYVYAAPGGGSCPATASGNLGSYEISGTGPWSGGEPIAAGSFARSRSFSPSSGGPHRICGYVTESAGDTPHAIAEAQIDVFDPVPPRFALRVDVPATVAHGVPLPISLSTAAPQDTFLFAYVSSGTAACRATAGAQSKVAVQTIVNAQFVGVGRPTIAAAFGPAASGGYRVCAYLADRAAYEPEVDATATFTVLPDPALVPVLVTPDDSQHRDRLVLRWRRAAGALDRIALFRGAPARGAVPITGYDTDEDRTLLRLTREGENWRAVVPHIGYGRYWWRIERTGVDGSEAASEARVAHVVPRPLDRRAARAAARVKLGRTSRRPGTAALRIVSSPRAAVRVVLRHGGRVLKRIAYTERFAGRRTLTVPLSCERTGVTVAEVRMRDPFGARATKRARWVTSADRCGRLRAAERRAAERRAALEREQRDAQRRRESGSGGGGGGGGGTGDVGSYSGLTCSEIGHDFYVTPGSDPEHDSDNDGHACESYA